MPNDLREDLSFLEELITGLIDALPEKDSEYGLKAITFRKTLTSESDRGCVLMAAAYIDASLEELLEANLINDKPVTSKLFEFNGPFGTFSGKIDTAYSLGLIPKNVRKDIHLIRKYVMILPTNLSQ